MAAVTRLGLYGGPRAPYAGFTAATASVVLTVGALTEAQVRTGGQTLVLVVSNDTFVTLDDTIRQAIIDGLTSDGAEATGWNAEVRDKEVVGAVVRDSSTQITITLSAAAAYDITANETITATVPASAFTTSADAVVASPTFAVSFVAVTETAATGGWIRRRRPDEETEGERRARIEAERRRLGLLPPEPAPPPSEAPEAARTPVITLRAGAGPNVLDDGERDRLVAELEALQAQADEETDAANLRRRRLAIVLLLAA